MKAGVDKKIESSECPSWLQFPGAASLPMSSKLRKQHLQFCESFSSLLPGGKFNGNIYLTAYKNMLAISEIPNELLALLEISSVAEAQTLTGEQILALTSKGTGLTLATR
jgi:hypothetical protein